MKTVLAETALRQVLDVMETEDWDQLTSLLADDVELADELTATWLRGRDRVAAYLRAQTGIVTNITNTASDISSRMIGDRVLVTFSLRQRYLLEGVTRRERLTGCAIFETDDGLPLLTLFHLGEADSAAQTNGRNRAAGNRFDYCGAARCTDPRETIRSWPIATRTRSAERAVRQLPIPARALEG